MSASGPGDEEGGLFADINVTPLVDVTLVLLIIFMVAAPLILSSPSIKVQLPKAASADVTERTSLALTLERDGGAYHLFANGRRTDEDGVRRLIPDLLRTKQEVQAVIA